MTAAKAMMEFVRPGGGRSVCGSEPLSDSGVRRIFQKQMGPHTTQSWQPCAKVKQMRNALVAPDTEHVGPWTNLQYLSASTA